MQVMYLLKLVWDGWKFSVGRNIIYIVFIAIMASSTLVVPLLPANNAIWTKSVYLDGGYQYIGFSKRSLTDSTIINSLEVGEVLINSYPEPVTAFSMQEQSLNYSFFNSKKLLSGRYPQAADEVAISWSLARSLNLAPENEFTVRLKAEDIVKKVKVVGIIQPLIFNRYQGSKFLVAPSDSIKLPAIEHIYFLNSKPKIDDLMLIDPRDITPNSFFDIFPDSFAGRTIVMWSLLTAAFILLTRQVKSIAEEGRKERQILWVLGLSLKQILLSQFLGILLTTTVGAILSATLLYFFAVLIFGELISSLLMAYFLLLIQGFLLVCSAVIVLIEAKKSASVWIRSY
ncbi:MAG: hypothetical protein QME63_04720 [Actinomycetota bacterium]|nr:hypothetical protein [Actinomycetota bacterium]